jgi:hypothetical protein
LDARLGDLVRPLTAFCLLFSGFIAIVWSIGAPSARSVALYSRGELAKAEGALTNAPVNAVFATAPTHNHVLTYFGRMRAVGYHGHLWSHGYRYESLAEEMKALYQGRDDWPELAKALGVTHIYWGPQEREAFGEGERSWMFKLQNISRVADHQIYVISQAAKKENR